MIVPVGAPYHFRGTAKMVWGRSISVPIKRTSEKSEVLGLLSYSSNSFSMSDTLFLIRSRMNAMKSRSNAVLDTVKISLSEYEP